MIINVIEGATRRLGKTQGFNGLPIRDEVIKEGPRMASLWEPTPRELEILARGGKIQLSILGTQHPPVLLEVVERET